MLVDVTIVVKDRVNCAGDQSKVAIRQALEYVIRGIADLNADEVEIKCVPVRDN